MALRSVSIVAISSIASADFGPMSHRLANRPHFEAVAQGAQSGTMSDFPGIAQTDQTNA